MSKLFFLATIHTVLMCVPLRLALFHNAAITRQHSATITVISDNMHNICHENIIKTGAPFWKNPADMLTIPGSN
jgi:hypothetical protein